MRTAWVAAERVRFKDMTRTIAPLISLLAFGLFSNGLQAESLIEGSAEKGKTLAMTCGACHGMQGNSMNPSWPNLAGQGAPYILAQLKAFKNGARSEPLMLGPAAILSEQDMQDLAVYFESLPTAAQTVANASLVHQGEALYRGGDKADATAACMACHGPTGSGNPTAKYPALRGQHATYTAKQLRDYASGIRTTDGKTRVMREIAETLSKDEIEALSSYIQGLK